MSSKKRSLMSLMSSKKRQKGVLSNYIKIRDNLYTSTNRTMQYLSKLLCLTNDILNIILIALIIITTGLSSINQYIHYK